jgi:hypothetical protein
MNCDLLAKRVQHFRAVRRNYRSCFVAQGHFANS